MRVGGGRNTSLKVDRSLSLLPPFVFGFCVGGSADDMGVRSSSQDEEEEDDPVDDAVRGERAGERVAGVGVVLHGCRFFSWKMKRKYL